MDLPVCPDFRELEWLIERQMEVPVSRDTSVSHGDGLLGPPKLTSMSGCGTRAA
ncbi:uncharacterized protein METZ01_LOCUS60526 [marine metagenome]|uniref:Uncharacterized protein n=1 Tax=marine metagenome TaxID=408172 RepID=A0A381SUH4_9ZZZZ